MAGHDGEGSSFLHRQFVQEDVLCRMHVKSLHFAVVTGLYDAPEWLHDRPILLQNLLQLSHYLAAPVDFQNPLGLRQQSVELGIAVV